MPLMYIIFRLKQIMFLIPSNLVHISITQLLYQIDTDDC